MFEPAIPSEGFALGRQDLVYRWSSVDTPAPASPRASGTILWDCSQGRTVPVSSSLDVREELGEGYKTGSVPILDTERLRKM